MTLINATDVEQGFIAQPDDRIVPEDPTLLETTGAAFALDNPIYNVVDYLDDDLYKVGKTTLDPEFDLSDEIEGTKYEPYALEFTKVNNAMEAGILKEKIDEREYYQDVVNRSGGVGVAMQLVAGVLDPVNLIPIGAGASTVAKGGSLLKAAGISAATGGAASVISEATLQATQKVRQPEETLYTVAAGTFLGGILGTGAAAFARRAGRFDDLAKEVEADMEIAPDGADDEFNKSVGAAERIETTLSQEELEGTFGFDKVFGQLNPVLRMSQSPSRNARVIGQQLYENTLYTHKNKEGIATPTAVETLREETLGRNLQAVELRNNSYKSYSKRTKGQEGRLTTDKFNEQISFALRRGDRHEIPEVAQAAKDYRRLVFEPLKKRAIELDLLPKGVDVTTAESYLMRIYNTDKIVQKEPEFRRIIEKYVRSTLDSTLNRRNTEFVKKEADLQAKIDKSKGVAKKTAEDKLIELRVAKRIDDDVVFDVDGNYDGYVKNVSQNVVNTLKGMEIGMPAYDVTVTTRGPLKERTLNIPDAAIEEFLENDIEYVAGRYSRVMGTDVELVDKFGSVTLDEQVAKVNEDYEALANKITGTDRKAEKRRADLEKRRKSDLQDLTAGRDLLRGTLGEFSDDPSTGVSRTLRAIRNLQYMSKLGGVTISSFPDVARTVMVHGFGRAFDAQMKVLMKKTKGIKILKEDAKLAGQLFEHVSQGRMATLAEIGNPYRQGSAFEKFIDNATVVFTKATGMTFWNNSMKYMASVATQVRMLDNLAALRAGKTLDSTETKYMAMLGLDPDTTQGIQAMLRKHGETLDGIKVANTAKWEDEKAASIYRAALNKDVNRTIVTKGVGDIPLRGNTDIGKMILQFRSFALAANQRVFLSGLQQRDKSILYGVIYAMTMGMATYAFKAIERGEKLSDNPGKWIIEGFDRSGIAPMLMEVNNLAEKAGAPGLSRLAGAPPVSRFASRNIAGALLGPTIGTLQDVGVVTRSIFNGDIKESDIRAMRRMMPFQNLIGVRTALDQMME